MQQNDNTFVQAINDAMALAIGRLTMDKLIAETQLQLVGQQLNDAQAELNHLKAQAAPPIGTAGIPAETT